MSPWLLFLSLPLFLGVYLGGMYLCMYRNR